MPLGSVALIPKCAECEAVWRPVDEERRRAYLGGDDLDEPGELAFYCPECAVVSRRHWIVVTPASEKTVHSPPVPSNLGS
jgi:hypothetical protein